MGIIVTDTLLTASDVTALTSRSELAGYADDNVMVLTSLSQRFIANDATVNDWLLKFDFGAAQSLAAIALLNVNFNTVLIQGHATDSWAAPTFSSGNKTVSQDLVSRRYNIYIPLAAFNYRWLRVFIPTGTTLVGGYTTKLQVGSIALCETAPELSVNMAYGYEKFATKEKKRTRHGAVSKSSFWSATVRASFGVREKTNETELRTLNAMDNAKPQLFYENNGNTSQVWIMERDNDYVSSEIADEIVTGNTITWEEYV